MIAFLGKKVSFSWNSFGYPLKKERVKWVNNGWGGWLNKQRGEGGGSVLKKQRVGG